MNDLRLGLSIAIPLSLVLWFYIIQFVQFVVSLITKGF